MMDESESLNQQILRAASAITETAYLEQENLLLAKQQVMAAYTACEGMDNARAAEHLCFAIQALVQELREQSND